MTLIDHPTRETLRAFLAQYDTLAIATVEQGQPYVTRVFYVEQPIEDSITLHGTFITTSRKLANLRQNPRVGLFIGPAQPTAWLEATALTQVISDEDVSSAVRERLGRKSAVAAAFIARVPIVAVALQLTWLSLTNVAASPMRIELAFPTGEHTQQGEALSEGPQT